MFGALFKTVIFPIVLSITIYGLLNHISKQQLNNTREIIRVIETVCSKANTNKERESSSNANLRSNDGHGEIKSEPIERMIKVLNSTGPKPFFQKAFWSQDYHSFAYSLGRRIKSTAETLLVVEKTAEGGDFPSWRKYHANIRLYSLYDSKDPAIDSLLTDMTSLPIADVEEFDIGTQLKFLVHFANGGQALMKPMRYSRDWPVDPNLFFMYDQDRHVAEIAAFHLDRLLYFERVPPVVGRRINLTEIYSMFPESAQETFYTSAAGNTCFYGDCEYCNIRYPACGSPDIIEVSLMVYLEEEIDGWSQPYAASEIVGEMAPWEDNEEYCETLKKEFPFNSGKLLLYLIEAHMFDFLNGNRDRHSLNFFEELGNFSVPVLLDNGSGYPYPNYDDMSILAPLRQCCIIRKSTFLKYLKLYMNDEKLSTLIERSLAKDPVSPILIKGHLEALDRRLVKILETVSDCIDRYSVDKVIV